MATMYYEKDCDLALLADKTVAIVGYGSQEINKDDYCYIEVSGYIGGVEFEYSSTPLRFGSNKTLETGKMYRVNTELD